MPSFQPLARPLMVVGLLLLGGGLVVMAGGPARTPSPGPGVQPSSPGLAELVDIGDRLGFPRATHSFDVRSGDLSGDGHPNDLVISYHANVRAYRNVDGTRFTTILAPRDLKDPHGCAIGDVDLDGRGDVYCVRGAKQGRITKANGLWLQSGTDAFTENVAEPFGVADPLGRGRRATFLDLDGDDFPDLFVGNTIRRRDGRPNPNRTYLNQGGRRFREVDVGLTASVGAECVQAVDVTGDGWEDLLVCGGKELFLFESRRSPDGTRRFRDVSASAGLDHRRVASARIADLDLDGHPDIAIVQEERLQVLRGRDGRFREVAIDRRLGHGSWVVVGEVDGRPGPDLFVVQGCRDGENLPDLLLVNDGEGRFRRIPTPRARTGCGDIAETLDMDGDGRDEIVVLNGRPSGNRGPVQVLTGSPALLPGTGGEGG